jgi:hypothetical protein
MKNFFFYYGTVFCFLFAVKVFTGRGVFDLPMIKKWSPSGRSMYHK